MKSTTKIEAVATTYTPFLVGAEDIILTAVTLPGISQGDRIVLSINIGWEKPSRWDMGEIEVFIRQNTSDGPILYWSLESCYLKARTRESITLTGNEQMEHFYLIVRSLHQQAIISGDYFLEGTVFSEEDNSQS
ncbi:hypothetical protein [Paenibacillus pini]|nr:hypothetical protein [Paenibacillus pini]